MVGRWQRLAGWTCLWLALAPAGAEALVWKTTANIGLIWFYAQLDDSQNPVQVLLRVENHSQMESLKVTRHFVLLLDPEKRYLRPVAADEIVSEYLKQFRGLMPRYASEVDNILKEIRADYPQEKIVEVYGRLKKYMEQGHPVTWQHQVENWLTGKQESRQAEIDAANAIIEKIGTVAENYFWPNDIAPGAVYTGVVYFQRPLQQPVSIYFQLGEEFIGTTMQPDAGGTP